jgi:hypothetical protein
MKRILIFLIICIIPGKSALSQIVNKEPLSTRQTYYKIDARLDPDSKIVTGEMDAYWVNKSNDFVPDIRLHLYMNAFKSNKTTFNKGAGMNLADKKEDFGWIDLKRFEDGDGNNLLVRMNYISPDDNNPDDQTVIQIVMEKPTVPGDTVFIKVSFETKLPKGSFRTGYADDYFFVAQWFPKFGVYESEGMRYAVTGAWNCHQFHRNSEFYSNHSVYDVNISVPSDYVTGSGGLLMKEELNPEGKNKTLTYRAEDIVDFAWTAWPGYAVYNDEWEHVKITLLIPHIRKNQVDRQFIAVKNALEYLTEYVGPFPWPHLTFVDPPTRGAFAGGMEYTTLFTSSSGDNMPEFIHLPELVTVHEFGHAYFMGILASNEFEEPWLDEGVNSFWEARIMDHYWGENSGLFDHPLLKIADKSVSRAAYVGSPNRHVTSNREFSWNYPHGTYSMMSYNKAATILYTLMGLIGEETTNEVFREYYRRWAFKHPSGRDFINVVSEVVTGIHGDKFGTDMNWFFDQTLYGTGVVDYKVSRYSNSKIRDFKGVVSEADSQLFVTNVTKDDTIYKSTVQLSRPGDIILPVEVLVHFDNGDSILESWDGKERYKDFTYTGTRQIDWVKLDPEYKLRMDINFVNNSVTDNPDLVPIRRYTNKLIIFMQYFLNFISL